MHRHSHSHTLFVSGQKYFWCVSLDVLPEDPSDRAKSIFRWYQSCCFPTYLTSALCYTKHVHTMLEIGVVLIVITIWKTLLMPPKMLVSTELAKCLHSANEVCKNCFLCAGIGPVQSIDWFASLGIGISIGKEKVVSEHHYWESLGTLS